MSGAMPTAFEGIKTSPNLTLSLDRAYEQARDRRHAEVTIEHLLLALIDDPDATGSLEACGVDIARLRTDIYGHVTRLASVPEGGKLAEPAPSATLRHMLDQAVEAAREAKRQDINSYIVLAAIVGQEKSRAAAILQAHGFTFNEAIEALKPRPVRGDTDADGKPAAPKRAPAGTGSPADKIEEALAKSENALPPLPTAPPRIPRPPGSPAPKSPTSEPRPTAPPRPAPSPSSVPASSPRAPAQSVEDIMASVRDRVGTRGPAPSRPPPPPADHARHSEAEELATARPEPPRAPHLPTAARPTPLPPATGAPGGVRPSPLGAAPGPAARVSAGTTTAREPAAESFELGAPLPEDRINAPTPVSSDPDRGPPSLTRRREPILAPTTSPAPPSQRSSPPGQRPAPAPAGLPASHSPGPLGATVAGPAAGRRNSLESVQPGLLAEAIPRRMRAAVPERVEVRIARRTFDGLAVNLAGRGAPAQHDIVITSAMSVRLKAPDGGFAIEAMTPETQWIENRPGLISSDEFASWRWIITPLEAGRRRLHLIVSARTAGPDGSTAETALPDQVVAIKVRTNYSRAARRWGGWAAAAVIGGVLGKFGEGSLEILRRLIGL